MTFGVSSASRGAAQAKHLKLLANLTLPAPASENKDVHVVICDPAVRGASMAMAVFCPAARCRSGQGNAGWSVHWRLLWTALIAGRQRRAKRTLHARSLARSVGGRSRTCAGKTTSSRAALGVGPSRRANARARWPAGAWIPARARADCPGARDRARDPHPRRAHMQKGSPARGVAAGRGPGSARRC